MKDWKRWALGVGVGLLLLGYIQSERYIYYSRDSIPRYRVDKLTGDVQIYRNGQGWDSFSRSP